MWVNILAMGAYQFVILMALLFTNGFGLADGQDDEELYRNTIIFNTFVWMQIFNFLNCRAVRFNRNPFKGIFQSTTFMIIVAIIVLLQVGIIFVGGAVFSVTPINGDAWVLSIVLGATTLAVSAVIRTVGKSVLKPVGNVVI
jgi:Ca2+-transporting ATPase